jgi:hypothetical protein
MLAKVVNENADSLVTRGVLAFLASMLAPTEYEQFRPFQYRPPQLCRAVTCDRALS